MCEPEHCNATDFDRLIQGAADCDGELVREQSQSRGLVKFKFKFIDFYSALP